MNLDDYLATNKKAEIPNQDIQPDTTWRESEPVHFLADGTALKLTLSRRIVMVGLGDSYNLPVVNGLLPVPMAVILLFIAAHPASVWQAPVELDGSYVQMHYNPRALYSHALEWADKALESMSPADIVSKALDLWNYHHDSRPIPEKKTELEAKNQAEVPQIYTRNGSGSLAAEMPVDGPPCEKCLYSNSSWHCTAHCSQKESDA